MDPEYDVVVVGAGLAGLRCAARLEELGRHVLLVEASDQVGGRVATDLIDGFRCDRGFQVLNPAYPAIRRWVDVAALNLQPFTAGVLVRTGPGPGSGLRVIADPRREPSLLPATVRSGYLSARELAALGQWLAPVLVAPGRVLAGVDSTLAESLDQAGVTGRLRREVLDTFLGGVLGEPDGRSSAVLAKLFVRMFAVGRPGLPASGMAALPRQLAAAFGGELRLSTPVLAIDPGSPGRRRVHTGSGTVTAREVVVAASPSAATALTGLPAVAMHGLVTWWFQTDQRPHPLPILLIDAHRASRGAAAPVWNTTVISNTVPGYAPPGRHLVQATTLMARPDGADEAGVRAHLAYLYGCDTSAWQVVTRHQIPQAVVASPPPLQPRRTIRLDSGVYVCGDHRDTASIQGALVSGNRTAEAVSAVLGLASAM